MLVTRGCAKTLGFVVRNLLTIPFLVYGAKIVSHFATEKDKVFKRFLTVKITTYKQGYQQS